MFIKTINKKIKTLISYAVNYCDKKNIKKISMESQKEYKLKVKEFNATLSKKEEKEIEEFYINNYGEKHSKDYHTIYKYFSGKFDVKFFPDDLGRVKLSAYANDKNFVESISDKNFLPTIAEVAGVKMPKTILLSTAGIYFDEKRNIISREEAKDLLKQSTNFIVKPSVDTGGSSDCSIFDKISECSEITEQIAENILKKYKTDFVVQKLVRSHGVLKNLNPNSFNTFRLITYVLDGKIKHTPGIIMIGGKKTRCSNQKGFIFVGISDDGVLNKYAVTKEGDNKITEHPTSGTIFEECLIPEYKYVIESAKQLHKYVPRVGIINWDFMIDEDGNPVFIEANSRNGNGIFLIQSAQGKPIFGEDTEKIMKWIKKMDKVGKIERYKKRLHL